MKTPETLSAWFTPEEREKIKKATIKEYFCTWTGKDSKSKERHADSPEALFYYQLQFNAVIYFYPRHAARIRLQRILRAVS